MTSARTAKKRSTFERLKDFLGEAFESEAYKHYKLGCERMGFPGAITEFEEALRLEPGNSLFKTALATAYFDQGVQQDMADDYEGAIESFSAAIDTEPDNPRWYSSLARAYKDKADVKGRVKLTLASVLVMSTWELPPLSPKETRQIRKLYKLAYENYRLALGLDPSDVSSYMELSEILKRIGRGREATDNLQKALAILNKAIQADSMDKQSYSERAKIFEDLGEIELAIADLERVLTFSTRQYDIDITRERIEELRKSKDTAGKG